MARVFGSSDPIQAGEFRIPAGLSAAGILDLLQHGRPVQRLVAVPEGMPSALVHERLMRDPLSDRRGRGAGGGKRAPQQLFLPARRDAGGGAGADAGGDAGRAGAALGAAAAGQRGRLSPRSGHPRLDRREGDRQGFGTAADRRRLFEPPQARHAAPGRSHGHLPGHPGPSARAAHPPVRTARRQRLQHLRPRRPAGRADRQSGARLDRRRARSGADQRALLRRRRHRRPRLRRHAPRAPGQCRSLAGDPPRQGRNYPSGASPCGCRSRPARPAGPRPG